MGQQAKQSEWKEQWTLLRDQERFLFEEWIHPNRLEEWRGKTVLDCGCGGGQHVDFSAAYAARVVGVDLNTSELARERNRHHANVEFVEADIATFAAPEPFDVVYCIGVIHHTDDPDATFAHLVKLCKPGGRLIVWCYSAEGNVWVRRLVEPARRLFFRRLGRRTLLAWSRVICALMYPAVYTVYRLPFLRRLPYYEYFENFRRLSFGRNVLNVFDKLNAPQTQFITRDRVARWFDPAIFDRVHLDAYKGVSWRASGTVRVRE